jgi:hypothetical protein
MWRLCEGRAFGSANAPIALTLLAMREMARRLVAPVEMRQIITAAV